MPLNSAETRQAFPFSYEQVFNGLVAVLPAAGYTVKSCDHVIGRIVASAGASALSWGEDIAIQVQRASTTSTDVVIQSNLKVGFNVTGSAKNSLNAERIIGALSHYLQHGGRDVAASVAAAPSTTSHGYIWVVSIVGGLLLAAMMIPLLSQ